MRLDKDLVAASATTLVLSILADGDQHGYAITKRVSELSNGQIRWSDGMLYPLLHRLERSGLVSASWGTSEVGRRRKHYSITAAGLANLLERQEQWQVVAAALNQAWRHQASSSASVAVASPKLHQAATAASRHQEATAASPKHHQAATAAQEPVSANSAQSHSSQVGNPTPGRASSTSTSRGNKRQVSMHTIDTLSSPTSEQPLADQIAAWRSWVLARPTLTPADADELEDSLREHIADLRTAGLSDDEAFIVAVRRVGALDSVTGAFAREHSERLWKQLVFPIGPGPDTSPVTGNDSALAAAAGTTAQAVFGPSEATRPLSTRRLFAGASAASDPARPVWWGIGTALAFASIAGLIVRLLLLGNENRAMLNLSLAVLPFLAGYFAWSRRLTSRIAIPLLAGIAVVATAVNLYPFQFDRPYGALPMTWLLAFIHLPVLLWLLVGVAYTGGAWRDPDQQMHFIRFTGEALIYLVLFALGGAALLGIAAAVLVMVGIEPSLFFATWLLPFAVPGALFVAAWLVSAKRSVVENMAPVLARVFTPLTVVLLVATLVVLLVNEPLVGADRNLLIVMDVILILVLALVLYATSARDPLAQPTGFDRLQLAAIAIAFIVNLVALAAMITRIAEYGTSANKAAALGLNLLLFVHLTGAGYHLLQFIRHRSGFAQVERWTTQFLPVYAAWAAIVVLVFPPLFAFA